MFSCKKDVLITDPSAKLEFSTDTVIFDTVFTTVGSITKQLKVYNTHKQPIIISNIYLAGGSNSKYRMNVDGIPGTSIQADSLWRVLMSARRNNITVDGHYTQ